MDTVLKLRELRRLRGLSQKDVARLSGVGEKTLSSFETGERIHSLKLSQLLMLLQTYNVTEAQFFGPHFAELIDGSASVSRSREQALLDDLAALPPEASAALLDSFSRMLDAARKAHAQSVPAMRLVDVRLRTPAAA
jgi:transcriptional regulator with XRE-family HTH domain